MSEHLCVQELYLPWEGKPYQLTNWWQMHQVSMRIWFWAGMWLERLKEECFAEGSGIGDAHFNSGLLHRPVSEELRKKALQCIGHLDDEFHKVGLRVSAETVTELKHKFADSSKQLDYSALISDIIGLEKMVEKELKGHLFLYVAPDRARYAGNSDDPTCFGSTTINAFPSAKYDAWEAARCMAFVRPTAAVFHLMRVLEVGLIALGKVFNVSLAHTNWAPALDEIESKIRNMHKDPQWKILPDCKEQQEYYSQIASHFGVLKDAYRNLTMHVRGKFTEEEAEPIFQNVRGFMQKLSMRLHE